MTIRPIDFQGAIFSVQKVERQQANKTEHNFILQQQIAEELKKKKEIEKTKIVESQTAEGKVIKEKKEHQNVPVYDKKKKKRLLEEESRLDAEA